MSPHSPFKFTLFPFEKLLRQFRELIKDFWYRNPQEKEKGALEIRRQKHEFELQCRADDIQPRIVLVCIGTTEKETLRALAEYLAKELAPPPLGLETAKPVRKKTKARQPARQRATPQAAEAVPEQADDSSSS